MPVNKHREVRVRPVRKDKPDVRALARVLIELAIAQSATEAVKKSDTAEKGSA